MDLLCQMGIPLIIIIIVGFCFLAEFFFFFFSLGFFFLPFLFCFFGLGKKLSSPIKLIIRFSADRGQARDAGQPSLNVPRAAHVPLYSFFFLPTAPGFLLVFCCSPPPS